MKQLTIPTPEKKKIRITWGFCPVTRVKISKKVYSRKAAGRDWGAD